MIIWQLKEIAVGFVLYPGYVIADPVTYVIAEYVTFDYVD